MFANVSTQQITCAVVNGIQSLRYAILPMFLWWMGLSAVCAQAPVVSNVVAQQRSGTKLVDITYDVTAVTPTVNISLRISNDGGASYNIPATTFSGAVGDHVTTGTGKVITWNAGVDWNGNYNTNMRFEVTADDGMIPPVIITEPTSQTIVSGSTATLTVTASGSSPLTYQWYQGAVGTTTTPVGTNSASFTTPVLSATTSYWVRVSNSAGSVNSALATITCSPTITSQPTAQTIVSGSTATLTVTASGSSPMTYQWYQGAVGTTTTPVGTNSASFTTPVLSATTTYWVRVSNSVGSVDSTIATVTVEAELALIPAGAFTMGRISGDTDSDAPSVSVTVSDFYMGKNEVTKALWDEVRTWAAANGYTDLAAGAGKVSNHPVQTVSWWDVVKWCNARSEKEGLTPCYTVSGSVMKTGTTAPTVNWSANGYRLPTEAEWEKAARGGVSGKRFPWGTDTISHSQANYRSSTSYSYDASGSVNNNHPTYATGSTPYTSPVGAFAANGYGLNDMAGNVWEWCWDWYGASTYVNGATDPRGAASGSGRVVRGGSWYGGAIRCRTAGRYGDGPALQDDGIGFRVARSSVP